jgi:hypothetical protein
METAGAAMVADQTGLELESRGGVEERKGRRRRDQFEEIGDFFDVGGEDRPSGAISQAIDW